MGMKLYSIQLQEKYSKAISSAANDPQDDKVPARDNQQVCMQLAFIRIMLDTRFHEAGEVRIWEARRAGRSL